MEDYQSLNHTQWECKYHVIFIPKCRRKVLYGTIRRDLAELFHKLAQQKESKVCEGHLVVDHVHMMLSIPPKYSVSYVVGYIKGKSAIHIARTSARSVGTSSASTSGREGTSSRRSVATRA